MEKELKDWYVYLLECKDKTYYCGITKNIEGRINQHNSGMGSKYTRGRKPVKLICQSIIMTKEKALKLEYKIKHVNKQLKIKTLTKKD
jgi:putative endonuclease